jgi:hypothetical protein
MLRAMATLTRQAGLAHLIAPVRPSHKDRYPAIPIERYARWARHVSHGRRAAYRTAEPDPVALPSTAG